MPPSPPSAHASTHLTNGTDPLSVGVPIDIADANAEGSATNFPRRDHVHKHPVFSTGDLHTDLLARSGVRPMLGNFDMDLYQILDHVLEKLGSLPTLTEGRMLYLTTDDHPYIGQASAYKQQILEDDRVSAVFSGRHICSQVSTSSVTYVTIVDSDVIINAPLFKYSGTLYVKFLAHLRNSEVGYATYAQLYRQHAATVVTGTEVSVTNTAYQIAESPWVDISGETGPESYQVQMKVPSGGTGYCNCAIILLSYVQL